MVFGLISKAAMFGGSVDGVVVVVVVVSVDSTSVTVTVTDCVVLPALLLTVSV